jgi:glycosyltransferase involved in cell wall biosynthesis
LSREHEARRESARRESARRFVERGAAVHFLYYGAGKKAERDWGGLAASFSRCDVEGTATRNILETPYADASDAVREALERLHGRYQFGLIEFPLAGGIGFRTVQAKRGGLGFDEVVLAVRADDCSARRREREQRWPSGPEDLEVDFAERFCFENGDIVVTAGRGVVETVRGLGWKETVRQVVCASEGNSAEVGIGGTRGEQPLVTVAVPYYNLGRYLPEALASLAGQDYPRMEVLVVDDGSTDGASLKVLERVRCRYPQFRFLRQANGGIGAARNYGLREARGEFFVPMDADNVARPDMVRRFVAGLTANPTCAAMSCYFRAFADGAAVDSETLYDCRPLGGPWVLASLKNVYGDATAIFRTAALRQAGGYGEERETSFEDWEVFVKLANAGMGVGVIPDHLFSYRHREAGFSRVTSDYRNHRRVLRQFAAMEQLPAAERMLLWEALRGFHRQAEGRRKLLRYHVADAVFGVLAAWPFAAKRLLGALKGLLKAVARPAVRPAVQD